MIRAGQATLTAALTPAPTTALTRTLTPTLTLVLATACLLAGPAAASAQVATLTWDDPTLPEAVRSADLVVLAQAEEVGERGAAYRVEATFKGPDRKGDVLAVTGLHHPELRERPPLELGDRAYLILRGAGPREGEGGGEGEGEGFTLPTPTLGRFVRRRADDGEGEVAVVSMGGPDTFVRLALDADRFEALLLGLVQGRAPDAAVDDARRRLAEGGPEEAYVALWTLAELGDDRDAPAAAAALRGERFAGREHRYLRMAAARALARHGGSRGARLLLEAVGSDRDPAVRSLAATLVPDALAGAPPQVRSAACERLATLAARDQPCEPLRFGAADDPRRNFLPAPRVACLEALGRLDSAAGVPAALALLEGEELGGIAGALDYLEALGDAGQAAAIARRMRPAGSPDAFVNRLFGATLGALTGQSLGTDRDAWLAWCRERRAGAGPPGPAGPR